MADIKKDEYDGGVEYLIPERDEEADKKYEEKHKQNKRDNEELRTIFKGE